MGHCSFTTTEVYSNINLKKVAQDFPTIVKSYLKEAKIGIVTQIFLSFFEEYLSLT